MTAPSVLLELAGRVEALTEASREVDALVWAASVNGYVDGPSIWYDDNGWVKHPVALGDGMVRERKRLGDTVAAPRFTASIDAATSLFPADTMYRSGHSALSPDPSMFFCDAVTSDGSDFHSLAITEPNARLAACLRALAAREG